MVSFGPLHVGGSRASSPPSLVKTQPYLGTRDLAEPDSIDVRVSASAPDLYRRPMTMRPLIGVFPG